MSLVETTYTVPVLPAVWLQPLNIRLAAKRLKSQIIFFILLLNADCAYCMLQSTRLKLKVKIVWQADNVAVIKQAFSSKWLLLIKVIKIFLHHYFKFGKVIFMHIIFGITHLFKEQFAGKDGLSFQILENHSVNRTFFN